MTVNPSSDRPAMLSPLDVRRRQSAIIAACADPALKRQLGEDDAYGSPAAFWRTALGAGLVDKVEADRARHIMGSLWLYRGD